MPKTFCEGLHQIHLRRSELFSRLVYKLKKKLILKVCQQYASYYILSVFQVRTHSRSVSPKRVKRTRSRSGSSKGSSSARKARASKEMSRSRSRSVERKQASKSRSPSPENVSFFFLLLFHVKFVLFYQYVSQTAFLLAVVTGFPVCQSL